MNMPFSPTYSFTAVLKDGLSVFHTSRPYVVKASKLSDLRIYFQTQGLLSESDSVFLGNIRAGTILNHLYSLIKSFHAGKICPSILVYD